MHSKFSNEDGPDICPAAISSYSFAFALNDCKTFDSLSSGSVLSFDFKVLLLIILF